MTSVTIACSCGVCGCVLGGFGEVYIFRWDVFCLIHVSKQSIYHGLARTGVSSTV